MSQHYSRGRAFGFGSTAWLIQNDQLYFIYHSAVNKKSPFTVPGYFTQTADTAAKQRQRSWLKKLRGKKPLFCISSVRFIVIIDNTMVIERGFFTHWLVYEEIYFGTDIRSYYLKSYETCFANYEI